MSRLSLSAGDDDDGDDDNLDVDDLWQLVAAPLSAQETDPELEGLLAFEPGAAAASSSSVHGPQPSSGTAQTVSRCWGAQLKALHVAVQPQCDADFVTGKTHLKNKFCTGCRQGFLVPASHVRALTPELALTFVNSNGSGVWSRVQHGATIGLDYRLANQTKNCHGTPLVIFRATPPNMAWAPLPPEWLSRSGTGMLDTICFVIANGTLVPMGAITRAYGARLSSKRQADTATTLEPNKRVLPGASTVVEEPSSLARPATGNAVATTTGATMATAAMTTAMSGIGAGSSDAAPPGSSRATRQSLLASFLPSVFPTLPLGSRTSGSAAMATSATGANVLPRSSSSSSSSGNGSGGVAVEAARFLPSPLSSRGRGGGGSVATEEQAEAARFLPSPPMSPPDAITRPSTADAAAPPPVTIHPLTLEFSCRATEDEWRAAHKRSILGVAAFAVPIPPAIYLGLGLSEPNEGSRIWLLSWACGWLPASLLVLALYARHRDDDTNGTPPLPRWVPRLLDWAACSLCILPQLLLVVLTWGGVADPIDARDPANGAETFGKCLANHFFAHVYLRINSTNHRLSAVTLLASAGLLAFQAPVSLTPAAEFALCRKGILGGLAGGYVLDRGMRHHFLAQPEQPPPRTHGGESSKAAIAAFAATAVKAAKAEKLQSAVAAREAARVAAISTPPAPVAALAAAASAAAVSTSARHVRMHPITRRFSSPALEQQYRDWLFACSYTYLGCASAAQAAMQMCSYIEGQVALSASAVLILSENAPRLLRTAVHQRGNSDDDTRRFRVGFLVYAILLLIAKLSLPALVAGGGDGDDAIGLWFFPQPLFMTLQGPEACHSWLLGATALVMSYLCPAWSTWRGDQQADAAALRASVFTGEAFAYTVDWGMRAQFRRRTTAMASSFEQA